MHGRNRPRVALACALGALQLFAAGGTVAADERTHRAVYHFVDGLEQASRGLEYIRNHLEVDGKVQIVVVAHAAGVDFLMKGAKTARGNEYRQAIEDLDLQGVKFRVCEITLRERGMQRGRFVAEAGFVPSGVAEITRLQQKEGFAYLKP